MIVFDVEIKKALPEKGVEPYPGVEYGRWGDWGNLGIACVCTYDIRNNLPRVFLEDDLAGFNDYISGECTAGFATRRFDNKILAANGVTALLPMTSPGPGIKPQDTHYDILDAIQAVTRTHSGWGLEAVVSATLGLHKSGHGSMVPVWWQRGLHGVVINYCLRDAWLEAQLLLHIIKCGWVQNRETKFDNYHIRVKGPSCYAPCSDPPLRLADVEEEPVIYGLGSAVRPYPLDASLDCVPCEQSPKTNPCEVFEKAAPPDETPQARVKRAMQGDFQGTPGSGLGILNNPLRGNKT